MVVFSQSIPGRIRHCFDFLKATEAVVKLLIKRKSGIIFIFLHCHYKVILCRDETFFIILSCVPSLPFITVQASTFYFKTTPNSSMFVLCLKYCNQPKILDIDLWLMSKRSYKIIISLFVHSF